jgi:hypothetical protein
VGISFSNANIILFLKITMIPKSYSFGIKLKKIIAAIFMPSKTLGCGHFQPALSLGPWGQLMLGMFPL